MRYFIAIISLFLIGSCVKKEFDNPPAYEVTLEPNTTIAELKAMYTDFSQDYVEIQDDIVIDGIVVSSDRAGQFYRELVIQDETAGLFVQINTGDLHADFPIGRKVYINCQGLVLGDYAGLKQLGGSYNAESDQVFGIEEVVLDDYIQRGDVVGAPDPTPVSITEAASGRDYLGRLIELEGVEFIASDTAETYAEVEYDSITGENNIDVNRTLRDCDGNEIIMRNSGFADFALNPLPNGNGTVTAVLGIFGGTYQLTIRDTEDVLLSGPRCSEGGGDAELISIQEVRDMFTGSASTLPANKKIKGIVTSDQEHNNITERNLVLQEDGGAGIVMRFSSPHNFPLGTELEVRIGGAELSEFNELLQINNVDNVRANSLGMVDQPEAPTMTIADILNNFEDFESELVTIEDVQISKSGGNTYENETNLDDGTASMAMFTRGDATFADDVFPTGTVTITGIVSQFGQTEQLNIRYPELDIETSGGGGDLISIQDVRDMYTGSAMTLPADKRIRGIVTSDLEHQNITERNLVLQEDGGAGIVVRFQSAHNFSLGTRLEVNIGGTELSEFNGLMQINNVDNVQANSLGMSAQPTAPTMTIQEILNDFESIESELVTIEDVDISKMSGDTYSGVTNLDDGTAAMEMYTTSYATFADEPFPTETVTVSGILSQGGSEEAMQLTIRYPGLDIEGAGSGDEIFFEDFQSVGDQEDIALSGWTNVATEGSRVWRGDEFEGDVSAQATAFNDDAPQMETWLVTPGITLDEDASLTFESITAFWTHDALTVFISTDFSGDVNTATWDEVNVNLAGQQQDNYDVVNSGPVDLSDYTGSTIFIGFRYEGSGPDGMTGTYQVDDIKVSTQ